MKKVLILGGSSDIGIKVIEKLIEDKNLLLSIHYNRFPPKLKFKKKINFIKKNLFDVNEKNINKILDIHIINPECEEIKATIKP